MSAAASNHGDGTARVARRALLLAGLATGVGISSEPVSADEEPAGSDERPQKGDHLVYAEGNKEGQVIKSADLPLGGPPVPAWPVDAKTKVVRNGSRLNEVLVVRLKPDELGDDTKARAADGIVAYSAVCTHAGCVVSEWVMHDDTKVMKCLCHNSEYDPRHDAEVVFGPAPRHLAALPLGIADGTLFVAGAFVGKIGPQTST